MVRTRPRVPPAIEDPVCTPGPKSVCPGMITWIYQWLADVWNNLSDNYDPIWDTLDIALVSLAT